MMKYHKPWRVLVLCLLAAVLMLPVPARAVDSPDGSREVSLRITCKDRLVPLTGMEFHMYLVASRTDSGELKVTDSFARYPVEIPGSDASWKSLAFTLEGYVLRDGVSPVDTAQADEEGIASFPSRGKKLAQGLYLVVGSRHIRNGERYDPAPFLILLPGLDTDGESWIYDAAVKVKYDTSFVPENPEATVQRSVLKSWQDAGHEEKRPEEVVVDLLRNGVIYDTVVLNSGNNWRYSWTGLSDRYTWRVVEKETSGYTVSVTQEGLTFVIINTYDANSPGGPDQNLPQTGQLWWPVPVLTCAGLLMVVVGLVRRREGEYEA